MNSWTVEQCFSVVFCRIWILSVRRSSSSTATAKSFWSVLFFSLLLFGRCIRTQLYHYQKMPLFFVLPQWTMLMACDSRIPFSPRTIKKWKTNQTYKMYLNHGYYQRNVKRMTLGMERKNLDHFNLTARSRTWIHFVMRKTRKNTPKQFIIGHDTDIVDSCCLWRDEEIILSIELSINSVALWTMGQNSYSLLFECIWKYSTIFRRYSYINNIICNQWVSSHICLPCALVW